MKRRKEVEQQLLALQADKKSVMTAAAQASDGNNRRALELENELSVCKAEMEKLGQNQKKSTTQGTLRRHFFSPPNQEQCTLRNFSNQ